MCFILAALAFWVMFLAGSIWLVSRIARGSTKDANSNVKVNYAWKAGRKNGPA